MNSLIHRILFILLLCSVNSISCFANPIFKQKYNALVTQTLPNAVVGMVVQDPRTGKVLFEEKSNGYFYPASNTKILTSMAALKFLGPHFQYETSLHTHLNKVEDGVLKDNLYFIFRGDPSLLSSDLFDLLSELKTKGITKIAGNIIIDDQSFQEPAYAAGWTWDSIPWYYSAPITSIILNENKVRFKIDKSSTLYDPLKITQDDKNVPVLKLKSNVIGVSFDESENSCRLNAKIKNNEIVLDGCWPIEKTPTVIELAIDSPRKLSKQLIKHQLSKLSIHFVGNVQFAKVPKTIPAVAIKHSLPLKQLLPKVLADSNNVYAESLTKSLGLLYHGEGSFQSGTRAIQSILGKDMRMDLSKLPLSDGSGQSRYNLITPSLLTHMLQHMYQDPNFLTFYQALSVNGKNGTLATRMMEKPLVGKIVAKTGSATGTSALSGYFKAKNGQEYIFSVLTDHSNQNSYALKAFEDKLCKIMVEEEWGT